MEQALPIVPTGVPSPTGQQAQRGLSAECAAIAGRNLDAPGFRRSVATLVPLVLFVPFFLIGWAAWWGSSDQAVAGQVTWGIILGVAGLGAMTRTALLGTEVTWTGLRRHRLLGQEDIPWGSIQGFTSCWRGRPGVWVVTLQGDVETDNRSQRAWRMPSDQSVWNEGEARVAVDRLNAALGVSDPEILRDGPGAFERLCAWTWLVPPVTLGLCGLPVLVAMAAVGRRLWQWIVVVATFDILAVGLGLSAATGAWELLEDTLFVVILVVPTLVPLGGWLATRKARRNSVHE